MIGIDNRRPTILNLSLYTGIVLIVISMLFLGQAQNSSFIGQAMTLLTIPAIFYVIGLMLYRRQIAPIASPGLVATGAWLAGVSLIHLYDARTLLPEAIQPYYWLVASLFAAVLISFTAHRVQSWMIVPLLPLAQVNAFWAVLTVLHMGVEWMPAVSFGLVFVWSEAFARDKHWAPIYGASAALLTVFLLVFIVWLPLATASILLITWGVGAGAVALIGIRRDWTLFGTLAVLMLATASILALPASTIPPVWLILAAFTIFFIERATGDQTDLNEKSKVRLAISLARAVALLLSGGAALLATVLPVLGFNVDPLISLAVLVGSGILLIGFGSRRERQIAVHSGLWLLAAAWGRLYFILGLESNLYGLWLAFFAVSALLVERIGSSRRKEKKKSSRTVLAAITTWPVADLSIGLSTVVLLWTALNISSVAPSLLVVTLSIAIGIWAAAALFYGSGNYKNEGLCLVCKCGEAGSNSVNEQA